MNMKKAILYVFATILIVWLVIDYRAQTGIFTPRKSKSQREWEEELRIREREGWTHEQYVEEKKKAELYREGVRSGEIEPYRYNDLILVVNYSIPIDNIASGFQYLMASWGAGSWYPYVNEWNYSNSTAYWSWVQKVSDPDRYSEWFFEFDVWKLSSDRSNANVTITVIAYRPGESGYEDMMILGTDSTTSPYPGHVAVKCIVP